jgi:hypothetical protein
MLTTEKQTQQPPQDASDYSTPAPFKNRKVIATELGVHAKTLSRWLQQEGIQLPKGLVSPHFQALIYEKCLKKGLVSHHVHACSMMSTPPNLL